MTAPTTSSSAPGTSSTSTSNSTSTSTRSWIPHVPAPLQRLFDAVPLVTYGPNQLPCGSPGPSDLPTLHVFITDHDAARGAPSYNPSCLKWQTFLRIAGVKFDLRPSTNHASPTGSLPFLLPALSTITPTATTTTKSTATTQTATDKYARLDGRATRPIPSSRLEAYAAQHGALPPPTMTQQAPTPQLQSQARRRQAYESLLDGPLRTAWLYALYLSPPNETLLRRWYVDPFTRSSLVRDALLRRVRAVARTEVAKSAEATTAGTAGDTSGWKLSGNIGDLFSWAMAGTATIDPDRIYADARRALDALETLLFASPEEADCRPGEFNDGSSGSSGWFFGAPHPTLFDAAVFSYVYLILHGARVSADGGGHDDGGRSGETWGDDALRCIVLKCPRLVGHARRIIESYWGDLDDGGWVSLDH